MQETIGLDVSKEWLDAYRFSDRRHARLANDVAGLKLLMHWKGETNSVLVVFEAAILDLFTRPPPMRCPHCKMLLAATTETKVPK